MKILIVKLDHIGDFALLVPSLSAVIAAVGAENVGVVTNSVNRQWRDLLPQVSFWQTIDFPAYSRRKSGLPARLRLVSDLALLTLRLRIARFTIAVDLRTQVGYYEGKLVCWLSGARRRVGGLAGRSARLFLTHVHDLDSGHESERLRQRLAFALGQDLPFSVENHLRLPPPVRRVPGRIVIHPGAGYPAKQWPVAHWRALIASLAQEFPAGEILVTGGGNDTALATIIAAGTAANLRLTATIPAMAELIASAALLIGLDSAAGHLAALCGTRSITIFSGTTDPTRWRALGQARIVTHSVPCAPCWLGECKVPGHPCMTEIFPSLVFSEVMKSVRSGVV